MSVTTLRIVHVDDDIYDLEHFNKTVSAAAGAVQFSVESLSKVEDFRERLTRQPIPDVCVLDIHIGGDGETGVALAAETKAKWPRTVVVMRSIADDAKTVSDCLRSGADDFLSKKTDKGELCHRLGTAHRLAQLKAGHIQESSKASSRRFVGTTIQTITQRIPNILDSAIGCVHVTGESGSGKEVVAEAIAAELPKSVPFVKVNCGAIAPNLLESELFGHKKGAFTGATSDRQGMFESANGGWIFLDEVANLTPPAQSALLRVIENKELFRVGSTTPIHLSIKVISATNESLEKKSDDGSFRKDLWQRLCEVTIPLPPLRERPEEIGPLIDYFCATMANGPYQVSLPAREILCAAPWLQGNVRELRNCLRAMTEFSSDKLLTPLSIPKHVWESLDQKPDTESAVTAEVPDGVVALNCPSDDPLNYDVLSDQLLLKLTQLAAASTGKVSLRGLSRQLHIPRSSLTERLKSLVEKGLINFDELSRLVNIGSSKA